MGWSKLLSSPRAAFQLAPPLEVKVAVIGFVGADVYVYVSAIDVNGPL